MFVLTRVEAHRIAEADIPAVVDNFAEHWNWDKGDFRKVSHMKLADFEARSEEDTVGVVVRYFVEVVEYRIQVVVGNSYVPL